MIFAYCDVSNQLLEKKSPNDSLLSRLLLAMETDREDGEYPE